ncbi:MAG: hypothetical protein D6748_10650 [Calditrichaeota bacterium]|nr:MAG: hypothetical protein D6748_10650 [Calditrichota bacterium]
MCIFLETMRCPMRLLIFSAWFLFISYLFPQSTVVISDFNNTTHRFYLNEWEARIPEFLKHELSRSNRITVVERKHLKEILEEKALSMAGLTDSSSAREIGKMLGAEYIITGNISEVGNKIRIDAHLIHVDSRKVVSEKVVAPDTRHLNEMIELLGNNLRYQLTGENEYRKEKILKKYPTLYGVLFTGAGITATVWIHNRFKKKQDEYRSATSLTEFDPLYNSANRLNKLRYVLGGVAGTSALITVYFWLKNLSPQKIYAQQPSCLPFFAHSQKGEYLVGVQISF